VLTSVVFVHSLCGTSCSEEGSKDCTVLGGFARLRSMVYPTTTTKGTRLDRGRGGVQPILG
jgi:hypothetical protein